MNFYEEISNYSFIKNNKFDNVFCDLSETPLPEFLLKLFNSVNYCPWIFSLIGSMLVGLSGIFPLLVIPVEDGEKLKFGGK